MSSQSTIERIKQTHAEVAEPKPLRSLNVAYDEKLDHMRFLAAFMIIILHTFPPIFSVLKQVPCDWNVIIKNLSELNGIWLVPRALLAEGQAAVGLFLTISGFLFARITSRSDIVASKFYLNRLLRIYPLYLSFILLALFLSPGDNPFQSLALSVLTLQNLPQATSNWMLTPHLWSVAVEFQIYLIFPVILSEFRSKGFKALFLFLALALAFKLMVYLLVGDVQNLAYRTTFGRIDQFLIGAMLGYGFDRYKERFRNPVYFLLAFALVAGVISAFHAAGGNLFTARKSIWIVWPAIEAAVWGIFMASYCASDIRLPAPLSKLLCFLGGISYSLYVTHYAISVLVTQRLCGPVYNFNNQYLVPIFGNGQQECFVVGILYAALVVVPITALVSCLTYYAIEKPFMNLRVKYTKPINTDTVSPR